MDGKMDRWKNGWMERWMDGKMDGWKDGWMDGWMDGKMDGWKDGWMDGWMERWMDGWVDGWVDDSMVERRMGACAQEGRVWETRVNDWRRECMEGMEMLH